ncbi:MAG: GNAT family acetyltransferase [Armatimonadetes bacterium]|nr:GNAT family acetyltransferase [Armatimonadota bacterium]
MIVRPYQPTDEEQVVALWHDCQLVVPWNDPKEEIERKMQVQPELFLVGVVGERVAATVMAGYDGHRGWLYALAVAPDRQRQGLGRRMVEEAEARLKALGCHKINLQVRASNTAVIGFYEGLGFCVEDRVSMGKRL